MKFAVVKNARDAKQLWAYLPENYRIIGGDIGWPGKPVYVIAGTDEAGWTLADYVIPRLASGLIFATELVDTNEVTKEDTAQVFQDVKQAILEDN